MMRSLLAIAALCFFSTLAVAQTDTPPVDEQYLHDLGVACGFGLDEACDELVEIEERGKIVGLTICNHTPERVRVAIANEVGEMKEKRYRARGWKGLDPQECHAFWEWPVKDAALHVSILHLFRAETDSGRAWSGSDAMLCTPDEDFDIVGDHLGDCQKRGYINIDLFPGGWHKKGYAVNLTR